MRTLTVILIFFVVVAGSDSTPLAQQAAAPGHDEPRVLRVAVVNTPDVVLDSLIASFEHESGYDVRLQITEDVFDLARGGLADLVIAHYGHAGTEAFMADGLGRWPRMVFANQAVLVGPASDPAGIRGLTDAAEAFRRIAQRGAKFLVNNAFTERYLSEVLWEASGAPTKEDWHLDLGLRGQAAIEAAAQRGAYTLWGLVPFVRLAQQRALGMEALVVSDPVFQRVMVSIVVNPNRIRGVDEKGARAFERFLIKPKTQARIRQFRHHGLLEQTWWPAGRNNAGTDLTQF